MGEQSSWVCAFSAAGGWFCLPPRKRGQLRRRDQRGTLVVFAKADEGKCGPVSTGPGVGVIRAALRGGGQLPSMDRGAGNDDESTRFASGRHCARPTYRRCLSVRTCKRGRGIPTCLPPIPAVRIWGWAADWRAGAALVVGWRNLVRPDNSKSSPLLREVGRG